jgi:dipeptidyl aminopeptidase/acylaminoacyl peptidase
MGRYIRVAVFSVIAGIPVANSTPGEAEPRNFGIEDFFALKQVRDPRVSPDGDWVAFMVRRFDLDEDKSETRIWMAPVSGGEAIPMTAEGNTSTRPRWSPDGRFLSFLSERGEKKAQVWTLDRRGGEAVPLTDIKQGVTAHEWSPDGKRLVLVIRDPKPEDEEDSEGQEDKKKEKPPDPWVIDRLQIKRDYEGYLDRRRDHLHIFDLATEKSVQITSGDYDDSQPAWSPDGRLIAFVSNRTEEPDGNYNTDIWLVGSENPDQGKTLVQVTRNPGSDQSPVWHPDGGRLAYITTDKPEIIDYAQTKLAVIEIEKGEGKILTDSLDRVVADPRFSADGGRVLFEFEDQGEVNLGAVPVDGGRIEPLVAGPGRVRASAVARDGTIIVLLSEPDHPAELFALEFDDGKKQKKRRTGEPKPDSSGFPELRRVTTVNDQALEGIRPAAVEKIHFASADGAEIEAFVYKPPEFNPEFRYPAVLWLHGGPMAQYDYGFEIDAQLFAANGYVVVLPNPRGSTGYGQDFTLGIWRDWGNHDTADVLAAVDHVIGLGYVDPERLGVGGWSYGGILTNYVITTTGRFAAAVSGASGGLWVTNYGHDHYQHWYEVEFGLPWENRDLWERLSPFNKVERITTPTMWVGGEKDWNVPIINSEQMYQSMKRLGRETLLVVYPGQHHGIRRPSYRRDLFERFVGWYDRYLKPE